jgi:Ino eighty subunit 1
VHHKILPIRHADGDPLTREDIQYDLLDAIFSDTTAVFTNPSYTGADGATPGQPQPAKKVTFGELYIGAILSSPKCTKVSRDKMIDTPTFATEFSKMCLLVNIGRINTTLACELAPAILVPVL